MADLGSSSGRRKGRSVTRLSGLTAGRIAEERTSIKVDPRSSKASGPNAAKFRSYLGVLARRHVSIIIPSWDDVEEADKNLIWQDIQAKRVAAQERKSKNDAPHLLSRGGYELKRKKKMMKARAEASRVESADRVESPPRYEMWIAARTKLDGQMTSKSTRVVVDKIEGLVEQTTQGSFVPHGRDDILTTAIGRLEHAGRVRAVGGTAVAHDGVRVRTKGSCVHTDVPNQCELYVEDDPPRLVAIGRVFEGGSTIHGVPLQLDWTRVVVDQFQDVAALVPLPNTEVQLVGQATGTFLAWPKCLVIEPVVDDADIVEAENDPISRLLTILPRLKKKPIQLQWDIRVFGVDSSDVPLYISLLDALEIVGGNSMLNISIIQLWAMYMDKLSVEQAQAQVYGFIEPQSIQKSGNTQVQIQQYMQTWMSESGRDIYMAPYIDGSHWQLMVIIPKEYTVVWFCSLHRKPSHEIKCQLQG
uniref:DUF8039 domain-containing protein n=2 Tax=Cajanus cajan TaxID=3821 RepID=A0A151SM16_CAJCA|nr:hypothetical protein KK1_002085 [Cajanus cajan]